MNYVYSFAAGYVVGFLVSIAVFVWLNRNQAARLDQVEQKVRDFKKPGA